MSRTVYVARHGETDWNREQRWQGQTDIHLSDVGREQAAALAETVRGLGVVAVRSSDLARARETAEIVGRVLGLPPVFIDPDLRERSFGCFEGLTRVECETKHPEAWAAYRANPRNTPPGAEEHERVIARMKAGVRRAAYAVEARQAVLIVSHGGALRALVGAITGDAPPPLPNGALYRLDVRPDGWGAAEPVAAVPVPPRRP